MRDMTEDLVGLVPPPEEPDPAGGGLPESVVLPGDYLHFLSVYGVGTFDMFLHVMAPEHDNEYLSVRERTASFWSVLARMSEFVPEAMAPLSDMLHAAASVAVWGSTDNGGLCSWAVPADGEALVPHRRSVHPGDGRVARALEDHPGGAEEAGRNRVRVSPETAADSRCQCAAVKRGSVMLSFRWVLGDMTDNSPEEIPALLADLANADEEHVDVGFEKGDFGVGVLADRWITIEDVEGGLSEHSSPGATVRGPGSS